MPKIVHLHINLSFAYRLHNEFLKAGIDSNIISLHLDEKETDRIKNAGKKAKYVAWLESKIQSYLKRNNIIKFGLFTYPILGNNVAKMDEIKNADIIYLHWVLGGFMNLTNIEQLAKLGKPIIFYMHDMWYMTGGCHHSFECGKYKSHCYDCQVFPNHKNKDLSYKEFEKKKKLYSKYDNFYFISPSKWLYDCAKNSALLKNKPIFHIPNVLDKTLFKPFKKNIAKQILNIGNLETVIAFGAISVDSPYKGWEYLQKALEILYEEQCINNITILIFGSGYSKEIVEAIPFKTKFMGYLKDEYSSVLVFNAIDVFIAPSLADNLPYTVYEALSCRTPVVAFDTGGIPDMIIHKKNGYLAKYKDSEDIAKGIKFCLQNKINGYTLPDFKTSSIIKKHLELFNYINIL